MVPALDVFEGALTRSGWLVGDAFSIADLNVAAALYRGLTLDLARWPRVTAWLNACWDRPAAKRTRAMRE
jgi:glutathione S-transferase